MPSKGGGGEGKTTATVRASVSVGLTAQYVELRGVAVVVVRCGGAVIGGDGQTHI